MRLTTIETETTMTARVSDLDSAFSFALECIDNETDAPRILIVPIKTYTVSGDPTGEQSFEVSVSTLKEKD